LNSSVYCQITTPIIQANFGLDGDLRSNFFNGSATNIGGDDWFNFDASLPGIGVIDTTGAAAIIARYAIDPTFRQLPIGRTMCVVPGTIVNNKLMIDAIFYRDYHGSDSTMYASGSSKNGMSPADWNCPVAQSVPDKNEILDVMAHLRRDGTTSNDSLWLYGGVSIEQTTGDRYFDFELYQTNMYYDRSTLKFYNYGPDEGHTSWSFNAGGNILQVGDIIFSASYGSSTLTSLEARIWVSRVAWASVAPAGFAWSGTFDGASSGSAFGYAGILPKTAGTFYVGLESKAHTWAGPYSLVRGDNSVVLTYNAGQFLEFAVNLSKLGLAPSTLLATVGCKTLFSGLFVKSRASTSFTAQLKDFVGPLDLFQDFRAKTTSDVSPFCGIVGPTTIKVTNAIPGAIYTWTTTDGHINGSTSGNSILVDSAGTYIVNQTFLTGCTVYASDTVVIPPYRKICNVLEATINDFKGIVSNKKAQLSWSVLNNYVINYFEIESSIDGVNFSSLAKINSSQSDLAVVTYEYTDQSQLIKSSVIYYRLKMVNFANKFTYSKIVRLSNGNNNSMDVKMFPNPVRDNMRISIYAASDEILQLSIYNAAGSLMRTMSTSISRGNSILNVSDFQSWPDGVYSVKAKSGNALFVNKMVLKK
ncbi:MAG: T9SS type A sorting domain-containing protein, partial [Ginsengibacter sp.]